MLEKLSKCLSRLMARKFTGQFIIDFSEGRPIKVERKDKALFEQIENIG